MEKLVFPAILLAFILLVPVIGFGTDTSQGQTGLPIVFIASSKPGSTPHNGAIQAVTGFFTVAANETIVATIAAVACKTTCGTTVPSIVSVVDGSHLAFTQKVAVKSSIEDFEIFTLQLPTTFSGTSDAIAVIWNQTTVGQIEASAYANVKGVGATQSTSGSGSTASLTITTTTSGSWIVGGTGFANNTVAVPNASGLIGRNQTPNTAACFANPPPYPCVSTDIEDTNSTQYINGYPFLYSSRTINGLSPMFIQGAIELTPGLSEPTDQTNECTSTNQLCGFACVSPVCQSGTSSCTVNINGAFCTTATISFPVAYTHIPLIGQVNLTLNPATPAHTFTIPGATQSNLITLGLTSNSTQLVSDDETTTTLTVPNTDTIIKSYNPSATFTIQPGFSAIVEGEGFITTAATSTKQVITITVEDCLTNTVQQTIQFETESLAIGKTPFAIKGIVPPDVFGLCASINFSAPAADANTSLSLVSLRVYSIDQGFRVWENMPAASTEIFGSTSNEQKYTFTASSSNPVLTFCVYLAGVSGSLTAVLSPSINGIELSSSLRVNIGSGTGVICSSANVALPTPNISDIVSVLGINGGGLNDLPAIGAISLSWQQTSASTSTTVPVGYHVEILVLTATSFKLRLQFDATVTASTTGTFNWQSIGT